MTSSAVRYTCIIIFLALFAGSALISLAWLSTRWYADATSIPFYCNRNAPIFNANEPLKVLSYNVQYMAGKSYFFFYNGKDGTDSRPSNKQVSLTLQEVAALIRTENPDVVLLQEVNDSGDSRTHNREQIAELQAALGEQAYPCHANAYYWKSHFIPHPKILGGVSMHLTTLSRFEIQSAIRHPLPAKQNNWLRKRFYFQRAILETQIRNNQGGRIALLNTHLDAWTSGTDLSKQQVAAAMERIQELENQQIPWVLGGDFNVLPPDGGRQWRALSQKNTDSYDLKSAVAPLYQHYQAVPSQAQLSGEQAANWYTYFSNQPEITAPDRTIDYLFFSSEWKLLEAQVIAGKALKISDHLPIAASLSLPSKMD